MSELTPEELAAAEKARGKPDQPDPYAEPDYDGRQEIYAGEDDEKGDDNA